MPLDEVAGGIAPQLISESVFENLATFLRDKNRDHCDRREHDKRPTQRATPLRDKEGNAERSRKGAKTTAACTTSACTGSPLNSPNTIVLLGLIPGDDEVAP